MYVLCSHSRYQHALSSTLYDAARLIERVLCLPNQSLMVFLGSRSNSRSAPSSGEAKSSSQR